MHWNQLAINCKVAVESLGKYKPEVSKFKITNKASVGGVSRTTKSPKRKQPSLAHIKNQLDEFLEQQNPQKGTEDCPRIYSPPNTHGWSCSMELA